MPTENDTVQSGAANTKRPPEGGPRLPTLFHLRQQSKKGRTRLLPELRPQLGLLSAIERVKTIQSGRAAEGIRAQDKRADQGAHHEVGAVGDAGRERTNDSHWDSFRWLEEGKSQSTQECARAGVAPATTVALRRCAGWRPDARRPQQGLIAHPLPPFGIYSTQQNQGFVAGARFELAASWV